MKKNFLAFAFCLLLLNACSSAPKVDLEKELQTQPTITVSWSGEENAPSVSGGFCNGTICLDNGDPDWSALTFTPYINGTPLTISVEDNFSIKELTVVLKDSNGTTVQNNLPTTEEGGNVYTLNEPFKHTGQLILSVKVRFQDDKGYGQTYFPLEVE